jgi:hypothetical protein
VNRARNMTRLAAMSGQAILVIRHAKSPVQTERSGVSGLGLSALRAERSGRQRAGGPTRPCSAELRIHRSVARLRLTHFSIALRWTI